MTSSLDVRFWYVPSYSIAPVEVFTAVLYTSDLKADAKVAVVIGVDSGAKTRPMTGRPCVEIQRGG